MATMRLWAHMWVAWQAVVRSSLAVWVAEVIGVHKILALPCKAIGKGVILEADSLVTCVPVVVWGQRRGTTVTYAEEIEITGAEQGSISIVLTPLWGETRKVITASGTLRRVEAVRGLQAEIWKLLICQALPVSAFTRGLSLAHVGCEMLTAVGQERTAVEDRQPPGEASPRTSRCRRPPWSSRLAEGSAYGWVRAALSLIRIVSTSRLAMHALTVHDIGLMPTDIV